MKTHWTKILLLTWIVSTVLGGFLSTPVFAQQGYYDCVLHLCFDENAKDYYRKLQKQRQASDESVYGLRFFNSDGSSGEYFKSTHEAKHLVLGSYGFGIGNVYVEDESDKYQYSFVFETYELSFTFDSLILSAGFGESGTSEIKDKSLSIKWQSKKSSITTAGLHFYGNLGVIELSLGGVFGAFTIDDFYRMGSDTNFQSAISGTTQMVSLGAGITF